MGFKETSISFLAVGQIYLIAVNSFVTRGDCIHLKYESGHPVAPDQDINNRMIISRMN